MITTSSTRKTTAHHRKFSLGDPVKIKVARANLEKKQLDFTLAE